MCGLVVLVGLATPASPSPQADDSDLVSLACSIPHDWLLRTWRGWRPDRSGDIQMIPIEPNFIGSGFPHVGPWDYVQRVPMLWYGPGFIRSQGAVDRPVTTVGIAPTAASLLRFPFHAVDGSPMTEALLPEDERPRAPKLIVTVIWDAGGRDVLEANPDAWPYLGSLIPKGTWYENMTVGSSPTSTAQIHANIGTGAFPNHHGLVGHRLRIGGKLTTPWGMGPALIVQPTLADVFDLAMGNEPKAGIVATVNIHFGMLGHGAFYSGGDADIGTTRSIIGGDTLTDEGFEWNLPGNIAPYYTLPPYTNDTPGFDHDVRAVDATDGQIDGKWRDNDIDQLLGGFDTPARIPYQERVLESVIEREGFGADDVPDLLYANFKEIDYISHIWTMNSPEMNDAVVAQDEALKRLVRYLNSHVGRGEWVLALTADHGAIPDPRISGAFNISSAPIGAGIEATFDTDGDDSSVVELIQPTHVYVDAGELRQNGGTPEDVARWIMTLTEGDTAPPGVTVPPDEVDALVFEAAFPSSLMADLPCLPEARG